MPKKTSLSLDREVLRKIKQEAKRQRRSLSAQVNVWLEEKFPPSNNESTKREEVPA